MLKSTRLLVTINELNVGHYERAIERGNTPIGTFVLRGLNDKGFLKTVHADAYMQITDDVDPLHIAREGQAYVVLKDALLISKPSEGPSRELTEAAQVFVNSHINELGVDGMTTEDVAEGYAKQATLPVERRPLDSAVRPTH